jgi:DNA replication and repair protein RecF
MLRSGAQRAILSGRVQRGDRSLTLEVTLVPGKANQARLNRGNAKPRDLVGILRTVVFAPEDLALVKGDPGTRRAFMDELCVALQPPLVGDLADYDRVLRQRSSLLKSARGKPRFDVSTLDVWDEKLADLGARIMHARLAAMEALAPHVERAYADVAPGEGTCMITYATTIQVPLEDADTADAGDARPTAAPTAATPVADIGAALLGSMVERRSQEIERGVCLVGPHRDDLEIRIGELPAKGYASHGESWSCALALRLGSFALLAEDGDDGEPVLILDDVFAELDSGRRAALAGRVVAAGQVLITAAVSEDVPEQLRDHPQGHRILHVTPGMVTDASAEVGT